MTFTKSQRTKLAFIKTAMSKHRRGDKIASPVKLQALALLRDGLGAGTIAKETGLSQRTLDDWRQQQRVLSVGQHQGKSPEPIVYPIDVLDQASPGMTPLSLTVGGFAITITAKAVY
jgi:hypothetical protein